MELCSITTQPEEPENAVAVQTQQPVSYVHLVEEQAHVNLGRAEETEPG